MTEHTIPIGALRAHVFAASTLTIELTSTGGVVKASDGVMSIRGEWGEAGKTAAMLALTTDQAKQLAAASDDDLATYDSDTGTLRAGEIYAVPEPAEGELFADRDRDVSAVEEITLSSDRLRKIAGYAKAIGADELWIRHTGKDKPVMIEFTSETMTAVVMLAAIKAG
jgi:hypothetical protein